MVALESVLSQEIVQRLGWTLLHFVWQATAIGLLLAILLTALRKSSANLRYIIACLALGLIVLLPVLTMQLVPVSTPRPPAGVEPAPEPVVLTTVQVSELPAAEVPIVERPVKLEDTGTAPAVPWKQRTAELLEPALPYVVSCWLLGVFGLSLWHLGGWAQLQRLRRKMVQPVDALLHTKLKQLAERLAVRRAVQLTESALVQIPTVVGWLRPVILLPASALTGLNTEQLDAILAHELAHVRRYDYLVNMLQTIVETLGFYHPAVWWISHKIRAEREHCCDDLAVSISGDRVGYARALTSMAEIRAGRSELAVAATGGNLFGRVCRLLGKDSTDTSRASWIPSVITILLIAIIALPITFAMTAQTRNDGEADMATALVDGFRENKEKFQRGVLFWTLTERVEGLSDGQDHESKGTFQLWWDGKKIATKFAQSRSELDTNVVIDKRTGGNVYDGGLLSRKPRFGTYENWFGGQVINWTGPRAVDREIPALMKRRNVEMDFSTVVVDGKELLRLLARNIDKATVDYRAYSLRYFDPSKNYGLVKDERYIGDDRLRLKFTYTLREVIPNGWFPVDVNLKAFSLIDGKVYLHRRLALDLERCSFNNASAIRRGIFEFSTSKEHEQLNEILEKFSDRTSADKSDNNSDSARESVENYIAAALAGDDDKAAEYAYPDTAVVAQIKDTREALQGQDIGILGVCIGEWNALAISSVIQADHGRVGPVVFHLKKVIQDQETHWLIDDIDIETLDTIGKEISFFLNNVPDAKTIIISADAYFNKQIDAKIEGKETSSAQNSGPDKTRVIHFPKDRAVGTLKVRNVRSDDDSDRGLLSLPGWASLGKAQGDVRVLAGEEARLEVGGEVTDLSFLADLEPNDLQVLTLSHKEISDAELVHLKGLTGLLGLHLGGTAIKGDGLAHLAPLESLRKLSLFNTEVSDAGLAHLSALRSLKYLNLYMTQVRGPGLKHLESLTSLVSLDLAATPITDEYLVHLTELPWLKELQIHDTDITDKGLAHLGPLRSLEVLILGKSGLRHDYSFITDAGLVHLKGLDSLKDLYLLRTRVTDAGIAHLSTLTKLEALDLTETQITGEGLAFLKDLPALIHLDLKQTGVSRAGLAHLKEMTRLKKLELGEVNISETDLKDLEDALPNCTVNAKRVSSSAGSVSVAPATAESRTASGQDKAVIQVDCLVLEIYTSMKLDRETIIAAENLLGETPTVRVGRDGVLAHPGRDSRRSASTFEEWIREVTGTTVLGDKLSMTMTADGQTTRKMVDLLASRGYFKILMNPTMEVVDGGKGRVESKRKVPMSKATAPSTQSDNYVDVIDYLEITPHILDDDSIKLLTEGTINRKLPRQDKGQPPIFTKSTFSGNVVVGLGMSLMIGGMQKTDSKTEDSKEPQTKVLFIFTPTIVDTDEQVENETDEDKGGVEILAAETQQQGTISGRCLDTNGRPVSNAQVLVFCQDYRQNSLRQVAKGRTDSEGLFTLGPITPLTEEDTGRKRYLVFVPANGHGPAWKEIHSHRQITDLLELTAYDSAEVTGTIVTEDLEPVAAAHVWVRGIVPPGATEDPKPRENDFHTIAPLPGWSSTTDSDGSFRISDVPDGARIQLLVSHRDFAKSIIYVKPGTVVEIEVLPAAAITGRVLYDKTGKPAAGVKVQAQAVERISVPGGMIMSWAETTTDSQGRYKLESLHGVKHNVWAQADDLTVIALDSFKAERGQTRQAPDLLLVEGGFITGQVIDQETGEPFKPGAASDVAIYGPSRPRSGAAVESSHIREDGSFRIRVAPGRNYIYLRGMDDWGWQKTIVSPPHHWVAVSNGQTAEVEFKIRKLSPDEIEEAEKSGHRIVMTIPKTLDEVKQATKRMKQLGVAIAMYSSEHDGALPQTLLQLRGYIRDKQDFIWLLDEVEYIGKGKTAQRNAPQIPIAYDSTLFRESNGTQVLFLDFSVRFLERRKLEELGVEVRTQKRRAPADRWIVLNTAVNMYAEEHDHKLPETLEALKPYVPSERHFQWVVDNVEYLAKGRNLGTMRSWAPIACEKTQFENGWFTDTLFRDGHTEGMYPAQIKKLADLDRKAKESAEKLMYFGRALLIYANDHGGKYPDRVRLHELREYLKSEESAWPIQPAYLGGGRTTADRPDIVIYYDIELMPYGKGTNVLFNDGYVEFASPERLNELNINKTQILIKTQILTVTDDFLKEVELDANSVRTSEIWSEHLLVDSAAEPNSQTYRLILDDLSVSFLLKAMAASMSAGKGGKVLAAPQVMVADGRKAVIFTGTEIPVLGTSEPNDPGEKPKSVVKYIELGTWVRLMPHVASDTKNVYLDFEWELRQIRGFKKRMGLDKTPLIVRNTLRTTIAIPDGKTLLFGGTKFTEYHLSGWSVPVLKDLPGIGGAFRGSRAIEGKQKTLLILIKTTVNPEMPPPPTPRSVDPDDPLVKELEKKFERSANKR